MFVLTSTLLASCSHNMLICCEPYNYSIYVDEQYVGKGRANCKVPQYKEYVTISCSEDGVLFVSQTFFTKDLGKILNIYIEENMFYSTDKIKF